MSLRIAILVSGRGSNMAAILKSIKDGQLDAELVLVFSNNPEAAALETAREHNIPVRSLSHKGMKRQEHERQVVQMLKEFDFDYLVLAGYMRVLSPEFLSHFRDEPSGNFRVINIHPSMLPAFPGAHAYEDAFESGCASSGITVHLVDEKVDHGPILAQESFPREAGDTLESFKARGLKLEHELFPRVLQDLSTLGMDQLLKRASKIHNANNKSAKEGAKL